MVDSAARPSTPAAGSRTCWKVDVPVCPSFPTRHRRRHRTPVERTSVRCSCRVYGRGRASGPVISDRCVDAASRSQYAIRNLPARLHRHGYPGDDRLNQPALRRTTQMFCDLAANVRCAGLLSMQWISRHVCRDKRYRGAYAGYHGEPCQLPLPSLLPTPFFFTWLCGLTGFWACGSLCAIPRFGVKS
jgi:hypothetical protein